MDLSGHISFNLPTPASQFPNLHVSTPKMEAKYSSVTPVSAYKTARYHNPEEHNLSSQSYVHAMGP
jgi:hypothetical protein